MERRIVLTLLAGFIAAQASTVAQTPRSYRARLSTVPMDLTMAARVAGSGSLRARLNGTKLAVQGTFAGLKSPATLAQVRRGPKGIRGPVAFDLTVTKDTSGTISGTVDLTPLQIADLTGERLYVQVHSELAPDGNLWGWLLSEERTR